MLMFCNILSLLKLLSFRLYSDNLIRNFSSAVNDYLAIDTEEKRTIMRRHAYMGRIIFYSILFFAYLASLIFLLVPIIENKDIQVNVSKTQVSGLPVPLTFVLGDSEISASLYSFISLIEYFLLLLNSNCNCGNKLIINNKNNCMTY